ncbi:hypothetical protein ACR3K2_24930 [Cryptosporidium serpentis]
MTNTKDKISDLDLVRNLVENIAPGAAFSVASHCLDLNANISAAQLEFLVQEHIEKYSFLVPLVNFTTESQGLIWGLVWKDAKFPLTKLVSIPNTSSSLLNYNNISDNLILPKYVDPTLGIVFTIQPSIMEVVDIEKFEIEQTSNLAKIRIALDSKFEDPVVWSFINNPGNDNYIPLTGEDYCKFNVRARTVVFDSEVLPKISKNDLQTLVIVRSAMNLKLSSLKSGSWHSEWVMSFPSDESQGLNWIGKISIHSFCGEQGNSHLVYSRENIYIKLEQNFKKLNFSDEELKIFVEESVSKINEAEDNFHISLKLEVNKFRDESLTKLRRIIPVNKVPFDWTKFYAFIKDPLSDIISISASSNK